MTSVNLPPLDLTKVRDNPVLNDLFFKKAKSIKWLPELKRKGFFTKIPSRITYPDGSYRYTPWPAGDYLIQLAKQDGLPREQLEEIINIALAVPDNDNPWAAKSLIGIACAVPKEQSKRFLVRAQSWLQALSKFRVEFFIEDWIKYLLQAEEYESALTLYQYVMEHSLQGSVDLDGYGGNDVVWHLDKLVALAVPALAEHEPLKTFDYLARLLNDSIERTMQAKNYKPEHEEGWTYSWKEPGSILTERTERGILGVLIDALALCVKTACESHAELQDQFLTQLGGSKWESFRRIAWFILKQAPIDQYSEMRATLKEVSHRDVPERATRVVRVVHTSPVSPDNLAQMPWAEIVDYLKLEGPKLPSSSWNSEPDKQGLIGEIEKKVTMDPNSFLDAWEAVKALDFEDLEPFISGLRGNYGEKPLPVQKLKLEEFLGWLLNEVYPKLDKPLQSRFGSEIARLVRRQYTGEDSPILSLKSTAAGILAFLALNPVTTLEKELEDLNEKPSRIVDITINIAHGEAFEGLLNGVFYHGQKEEDFLAREDWEDIKSILIAACKSGRPTLAHLIGQILSMVIWIDPKWTEKALLPELFKDVEPIKYYAAKLGYLRAHRVSKVMVPLYKNWVEKLKELPATYDTEGWEPERFLVGHITYHHVTTPEEPLQAGGLAYDLFINSPISVRRKAIESLRQFLAPKSIDEDEAEESANEQHYLRAKELFEWRANNNPEYEELAGMMTWAAGSLVHQESWTLTQIAILLKLSKGRDDNSYSAKERIVHLLQDGPKKDAFGMCEVLEAWLDAGTPKWFIASDLREVLEVIAQHPTLRKRLELIISRLSTHGYHDFIDLIK